MVSISPELLIVVAAINFLISLLLAWIASFIVYAKNKFLQRFFVSTRYLIRAHIDFLLMSLLLVATFYLVNQFELIVPDYILILAIVGAIYNPLGFVILSVKPHLSSPTSTLSKTVTLLAFIPTTIGFGYPMVKLLLSLGPSII